MDAHRPGVVIEPDYQGVPACSIGVGGADGTVSRRENRSPVWRGEINAAVEIACPPLGCKDGDARPEWTGDRCCEWETLDSAKAPLPMRNDLRRPELKSHAPSLCASTLRLKVF